MRSKLGMFLGSILLVACSQELSEEDARTAWGATNLALAQGSAQAQTAAAGTPAVPGQGGDLQTRAAAQVDYTWNCTSGGTAHFAGEASADAAGGSSDVNFTLATEFSDCSVSGVTISGSLDYAAMVSASGAGSSTTFTMKGSLSYSGEVDGSCDIDMTLSASVGGGTVGASYKGSICGHDASATLSVVGG